VVISIMNLTPKHLIPPPLSWFATIGVEIVVALMFFSSVLTNAVPSGYLGGLAIDRGWCRHAWQRVAIGLGLAASVAPVAMFIFAGVLSAVSNRPNPFAWSFIIEPTIGNVGWALGFALIPDADAIFQSYRTKPSGSLNLIGEVARVAWVIGLMTVLLVIFDLARMVIPTRFILKPTAPSVFHKG
jgi:hypothetical protein